MCAILYTIKTTEAEKKQLYTKKKKKNESED